MYEKTIGAYDEFAGELSKRYRDGERIPIERIRKTLAGCKKLLEVGEKQIDDMG